MPEKNEQPGVSGKSNKGNSWIDPEKMDEQKEFRDEFGKAGNLYGRSDMTNQESGESTSLSEDQVRQALRRGPEADIQDIEIRLEGSAVHLYGSVEDSRSIRTLESIVMNVPGVSKVISHVQPKNDERPLT